MTGLHKSRDVIQTKLTVLASARSKMFRVCWSENFTTVAITLASVWNGKKARVTQLYYWFEDICVKKCMELFGGVGSTTEDKTRLPSVNNCTGLLSCTFVSLPIIYWYRMFLRYSSSVGSRNNMESSWDRREPSGERGGVSSSLRCRSLCSKTSS
jgi:hypothetical protein